MYKVSLFYDIYDKVLGEDLFCLLQKIDIDVTRIIEQRSGDNSGLCFFCDDKDDASKKKEELESVLPENVQMYMEKVLDKSWQEKWKEGLEPFYITKSIRVVPFWDMSKYQIDNERDIIIDTTSTFGIGTHSTTQLMSQIAEELKGKYENVFDIGTGTGILSIIAKKFGAKKIWAIDIDKGSVLTAEKNFEINGIKVGARHAVPLLQCCDFLEFKEREQFDLVLANVLTKELIRFKDQLLSYVRPGNYLALSGIEEGNYLDIRRAFDDETLEHIETKNQKNWCAVVYKKRMSLQ
jgi:ribosomal protein L11 methyltransferase